MSGRSDSQVFDACVVGSGAGGGIVAHVLTRNGARVVMLEAGPWWSDDTDSAMGRPTWSSAFRGAPTAARPTGELDAFLGGRTIEGEPYVVATGTRFDWWRARMLGGRTNVWGRISLRYGPDDFRRRTQDGVGEDWPITYADVRPYYDLLDQAIGVCGSCEGLPNDPDGLFLPPLPLRFADRLVRDACVDMGLPCIPARLSVLTRPHGGRPACIQCGQCNRGCRLRACFSTPSVLLDPAVASGRLFVVTNAMACRVTVGAAERVTGVAYIDKAAGVERHVRARVVILAASACESARLLLNSACSRFPDGLGNQGGHVGRWLTDSTGTDVWAHIPALAGRWMEHESGVPGGHVYIPWGGMPDRGLSTRYHIEVAPPSGPLTAGSVPHIERFEGGGGFGSELKTAYRERCGAVMRFSGRGEMIPNERSYCELDPVRTDRWGIPVLRFHFEWGGAERDQARSMRVTLGTIVDRLGGEILPHGWPALDGSALAVPGNMNHELGCTRMARDDAGGVVDPYCRVFGLRNLYVADGGPFVSHPEKNPTWTIMALAWRTADHVAREARGLGL